MKQIVIALSLIVANSLLGQIESTSAIAGNPDIYNPEGKMRSLLKAGATFDSTFIYTSDTLELPFFDEFSKNHFQQYNADFSDPGVTFDKKYRILDNTTLVPIANNEYYTAQQTFRRSYDITTSTFTDDNFDSIPFKTGSLATYPVVYSTTLLYPPYYIYDTIGVPDEPDTVWISSPEYYQDSATQFFINLNDANAYWLDSKAYHNYRFAVDPWSLGVVTFDGVDEFGYPYAIGTTTTNYADFLTSKPLNLAPFDASDSVYFSFLYQPQGYGDIPEASDSLVVEFYAKDLDQWFRVWSVSGSATEDFKVGHIRLEDPIYFKKGFQFRFKNFGAMSGSLDHFHLDYVNLRALSGYQDTLFKDFAFSYPVGSLLKDYTSVPWDHFQANSAGKMNDAVQVAVHNASNLPENNQNGLVEVSYGGAPEGNYTMNATVLSGGNINYGPQTTYTSFHDFSTGYSYDVSKLGNKQTFDILATASAQFPNFAQNDSAVSHQYFANYYSYDDSTAEKAYGPTGTQARLAIKYEAYEADSLVGMYIHFVPTVDDVSNKLFLLTVWDNNGGQPGAILYEDNVFFPRQPEYGSSRNHFIPYYFKDTMKVAVGTTFFVGWRQFDADRLNVGLDCNLDHSDKTYFSVNNGVTWNQSQIPGSVMIRPIVSTSMDGELGIQSIPENKPSATIFPNPTSNDVTVRMVNGTFEGLEVYNVQGKLILSSNEEAIQLQDQPAGMYFIRVIGVDGMFKIIKN